MTDINLATEPNSHETVDDPARSEADIVPLIELLFFAYRDFVSDPDEILKDYGFGRAHHRVVHFVGRNPGMRVAELLAILRITKQSLARVLRELIEKGFIVQKEGANDRRQRLLYLTPEGEQLHARLIAPQIARISQALSACETAEQSSCKDVLFRMIDENDRDHVLGLIGADQSASS
jgi:DNA-binding MarR family transcriptional regulator